VARGEAGSFGQALINALADAAGGTIGVLKSYSAKGWHAQISKLTSSPRGYEAAASVGLSATPKTLRAWLAAEVEPTARNQALIAKAYARMGGRWPAEIERSPVSISGVVKQGDDDRERGVPGVSAALLIDPTQPGASWRQMRDAWESGEVDADDFEEWFIEDILEYDLGEGSEAWEFPGAAYTVVIG